jgi:hypothetical protein
LYGKKTNTPILVRITGRSWERYMTIFKLMVRLMLRAGQLEAAWLGWCYQGDGKGIQRMAEWFHP